MGKTHRRSPINKDSKAAQLEREWQRMVRNERVKDSEPAYYDPVEEIPSERPTMRELEDIRSEAEAYINAKSNSPVVLKGDRVPFSVQSPATDTPRESGGFLWWTGSPLDSYIPVAEYGNPRRTYDLRAFALIAPLVMLASSILTKKVQSLQWTIEGGRNLANKWQQRLNNFENGDGWDYFIGRWIRAYCESDKPACAEIIRSAPSWAVDDNFQLTPRGERAIERGDDKVWEIVDARVMDPVKIYPTSSKEFPICYHNDSTGAKHYLRPYQFMNLVDTPGVDDKFPQYGVCSVSRAVWAAQEDRMIIRYAMEKMSENPGAGIGVINASRNTLETALNTAEAQREKRGVVYYKGVIFIPVLDPRGSTKLEFLSFAGLPDGFNRSEVYSILKEITATAFGLDILELGSIPGRLGTATQAKVASQKGRTKSIGAIMQGIERAFRYKLLPESVTFNIKKHDQDEELQRAEIDRIYFDNAIRMAQFAQDPYLVMQYLADKGAIPNEPPYIIQDVTPREQVSDVQTTEELGTEGAPQATGTEAVAEGPEGAAEADIVKGYERIRIDRMGQITSLDLRSQLARKFAMMGVSAKSIRNIQRASELFSRRYPQYEDVL